MHEEVILRIDEMDRHEPCWTSVEDRGDYHGDEHEGISEVETSERPVQSVAWSEPLDLLGGNAKPSGVIP